MEERKPYIALNEKLPGISAGFAFRPETAKPMKELAEILLRGPSSLTSGERELIATFVSSENDCSFCCNSHRAAAAHHLNKNYELVDAVCCDYHHADISNKLKALLTIANKVRQSGKSVSLYEINQAKHEGASDLEIHDTILIAAAFSMYNRYVDGLGTLTPHDPRAYDSMGERLAHQGYLSPPQPSSSSTTSSSSTSSS